jgi:microcystin degradation protein MlrC
MKLAVAGFSLESVTFLPETTGVEDFERGATRGDRVITAARGTNSVLGGMVAVAEKKGIDLCGIVSVNAGAAAAASDEAYEKYAGEIVDGLLARRDTIDGCLLHLHGALATPGVRRADAGILERIKVAMGASFPVAVGMDLHGNLGAANVDFADVVAGYHFSPHTDMGRTGERAANLLVGALRGEIDPRMAISRPGIILPSIFSATSLEPLAGLMRDARAMEREVPEILDISIFCGFAYADVPDCGMAVVAVTDGDTRAAAAAATSLSDKAWRLRESLFKRELVHSVTSGIDFAVERARSTTRPICLLEHADRMNDSTYTLRALLDRGIGKVYAPHMFDPQCAQACVAAGKGARLSLEFGGKSSERAGGALSVEAEVLWAGNKRITVTGPLYTGVTVDLGPTALVRIQGVTVSIISVQRSAIDMDCFSQFNLDPDDFDYILLRSKTHFRHVFEPLCDAIVIIDTPDWGPADVATLPYEYADRALFPLGE